MMDDIKKASTSDLKIELRKLLYASEDGKVRGFLLAWCIFTALLIAQAFIFGGNYSDIYFWLALGFLLLLLIMAIKGRGSRKFIFIISGILAIGLFVNIANTTGERLKRDCARQYNYFVCYSIENYIWEDRARILRLSSGFMGSYFATTALYFCLSKRVKKHFVCGKRKAQLWRELERRDREQNGEHRAAEKSDINNNEDKNTKEELADLLEESRKLTNKIEELEKKLADKNKTKSGQ